MLQRKNGEGDFFWILLVNAGRYRQQLINLNHALIEKRPEWARRQGRVKYAPRQRFVTHRQIDERNHQSARMGGPTPPALLSRPRSIGLPPL